MALDYYDPAPLDLAMSEYSKAVAAANTAEVATDAAESKLTLAQQELEAAKASEATVDEALSAAKVVLIDEAHKAEAALVEGTGTPPIDV